MYSFSRFTASIGLLTLTFFLTLLSVTNASAATITVTRTDDRNTSCNSGVDCSLREAVALANSLAGDDTITFNLLLPATITLTTGEIEIASNINLMGPGASNHTLADDLTINANNTGSIFRITAAVTYSIGGLTLTGASVGAIIGGPPGSSLTLNTVRVINNNGGGIVNPFGALTVIDSTFSGNTAENGGAIYHDGTTLKVQGSTFYNNTATRDFIFGGDGFGGGAIWTEDPTVISNSTFSGNTTDADGGAVLWFGTSIETIVIRNSTITGNSADGYTGGVANFNDSGGTVANNIISLNTAGLGLDNYYDGGSITEINNYMGNTPNLNPLADNGGPTLTHSLQSSSPAIDAGSNAQALDINGATLTTDQRGTGFPRFLDGPDVDTSEIVDQGAFEFGTTLFVVTKTADTNDGACDNDCSLREAVVAANAQSGSKVITFLPVLSGQTINLTGGEIQITNSMTILGLGQSLLTVNGNNSSRIFLVGSGTTVTISRLTLTGGNGTGGNPAVSGGGAIRAGGVLLTLDTVRIVGNSASSDKGGGVYNPFGALTVINSTFSNNIAQIGGGIHHDGTTLKVQGSTFNGNQSTQTDDPNGGGAIFTGDPTIISNSTFSGNSSGYAGGGVFFIGTSIETLTIRNSTFTGNTAGQYGGGVINLGDGGGTIANNIISLNTAPQFANYYDGGSISEINNYTGNTPNLATLADNGGPTQTIALLSTSPALDAGNNAHALDVNGAALTTDQRGPGFPRILDGPDGDATATVDMGAYEGFVPANEAPVNSIPGAQVVNEDTPLTFSAGNGNLISISDPDAGSNPVQVTLTATNGTITLSGISGLSFTVGDGTADATMTFTGTITDINTALSGLTFNPNPNFNGAASLQITTDDQGNTGPGGAQQDTDTINITVNAVNDAPSFTKGADQVVSENAGPQSVPNWATGISPGPADEAGQSVSFTVTNDNNSLFSVQPAVSPTGTLTYTPAPNTTGTATVFVTLQDNGGTANGGADTSATQTFIIAVNSLGWTTTGDSGVTEDENNPARPTYTNFTAAVNSGTAAGTYVLRYNITAVGNLTKIGAVNTLLKVRFRDEGDGSRVTVAIIQSPITGGATTIGTIFDSDTYLPGSGFQTRELIMPGLTFDFAQNVYWLEVTMTKVSTTNQPGFGLAQIVHQ